MNRLRSLGLLAALFAVTACQSSNDNTPDIPTVSMAFSAQLVTPADQADLEQKLKTELTRRYMREYSQAVYWIIYRGGGGVPVVVEPPATPAGLPAGGGGLDTTHSETNVQETGVDEGDLVKTDGTFIYLARGTRFFILRANPAIETALVSTIDLEEYISELYLSGGKVTMITNYYGMMVMGDVARYRSSTRVRCYDVTNPSAPTLTAIFDFPGTREGSRRVGSSVYLVTKYFLDIPSRAYPSDYLPQGSYDPDAFLRASRQALAENLQRIEEATLDDILPPYTATLSTDVTSTPAVAYGDIYIPESGNGTDLSLVVRLDLSGTVPAVTGVSGVMSSWGKVYMSTDSLYLASDNRWLWIEPMMDADAPQSNPEPGTAVHKFSVAVGNPVYKGSARVDGWVNDRFSMSDYQGYLRVGTTRGGWWGEGISNQLAVLGEGENSLVEVGKITGIAPGERIYSMRFDRDRGYMVTFRQTDPLFTFDLSDPADPRLMGEIQVSGFATYLHLLDTESTGTRRLLTIGRSADPSGRVTGNKLQLFDVSDLAAPTLMNSYELGSGWSNGTNALYDPHAFLYYDPLGILVIPYYSYGATSGSYSSGLSVFDIGPASITSRGIVTAPTFTTGYGYNYFDTVDRSVIIGTSIYALAHRSVTVASAGPPINSITSVPLPESYPYIYGFDGIAPPPVGGIPMPLAPAASNPVRVP